MEEIENEVEESSTVKSVSKKWGIINGLLSIAFFIIIDISGLAGNQSVSYIGYLIFGVIVYLAHKEFKSEGDGYMSYGQGLGIGTLTMVISSIISSAFFFIYVSFLSNTFVEAIKEKSIMDMEDRGMSDAEIEQAMEFTEVFMSPAGMSIMGLVFAVFFGFIISLVISAITKNQSPEFS